MSVFLKTVQHRTHHAFNSLQRALSHLTAFDPDRVYLEGATDIYDLEHRMQVIERSHSDDTVHRWHVGRL